MPSVKKSEALLQSKVPSTPKTGKRQIAATSPASNQFQRPGSPHSKQQKPPECPQSRNSKLCFNPKYRPHPKREKDEIASHLPRQQPIPAARFTPQQAAEAPGVPSVKKFEALLQSKVPSTPKTGKRQIAAPRPATKARFTPQQAEDARGPPPVKNARNPTSRPIDTPRFPNQETASHSGFTVRAGSVHSTRPRAKEKRDRSHTLRSPTKLQTLFPKLCLPHTSSCPAKKYPISNCAVSSASDP